jgi:hypothetical protein
LSGARPALEAALATVLCAGCANLLGISGTYEERDEQPEAGPDAMMPMPEAGAPEGGGDGDAQIDAGMPSWTLPRGKLVYHRFSNYYAGDAEMFVLSFPERITSAELGVTYGLCHPLNGIFSPDGTRLVVMAAPRGEAVDGGVPCGSEFRNELEVWELDLTQPGTKVRITDNTVPDEDPQYFADGSHVLFKHDGHIVEWPVDGATFTACDALPAGAFCFYSTSGAEESKPVISADESTICYYEAHNEMADVYCFDRDAGHAGTDLLTLRYPAAEHPGIRDARPMFTADYLYFTRWRSVENPVEYVARKPSDDLAAVEEVATFCTDQASDYLDPFAFGDQLVLFSSDAAGQGGPDLFVARFDELRVYSLDDFFPGLNSRLYDVGAAYWVAPDEPQP